MKKTMGIAVAAFVVLFAAGCGEKTEYKSDPDSVVVGDFIQLGVYNEEPIVWRCVDIDENGHLMLADKILSIKPFDAAGENTDGSHGRGYEGGAARRESGSNYWADSNLRTWLNSTDGAGQIKWPCGNAPVSGSVTYNAYAGDAGFLSEFTASDLSYIRKVTQKAIVDGYEYSPDDIDENAYAYNSTIEEVLSNYDTALAEETSDRIFLIDAKQLDSIYRSGSVLGSDYYVGVPTQKAVDHSEYSEDWLAAGVKWYYWIRTPNATDESSTFVKVMAPDGQDTGSIEANDGRIGVRPAFYLETSNIKFTSGSGTDIDPYKLQKYSEEQ